MYQSIALFVGIVAIGVSGCKSSGFSGDDKKQEVAAPTPAGQPPAVPPAPCDPNVLKTTVVLNTTQIMNGQPGQFLSYDISTVNCSGTPVAFTAVNVKFDIDGEVPSGTRQDQNFTLKSPDGSYSKSGILKMVAGDLFGNSGASYYHQEYTDPLQIPAGLTKVTFSVDISTLTHHTRTPAGATPVTVKPGQIETIDTVLQFGDAQKVTQPVKFVN